jgi:hypothetical protein
VGLPLLGFIVTIYIYIYIVCSASLAVVLSISQRFNCGQVWRGPPDLADPPTLYFFSNFCSRDCHCAFPACHVAASDWAMWKPLTGPCFPCHVIMPHVTCHVIMPIRLYGLPRGTILLVHGSTQKCQNWVTRGSLWCCHVTMTS